MRTRLGVVTVFLCGLALSWTLLASAQNKDKKAPEPAKKGAPAEAPQARTPAATAEDADEKAIRTAAEAFTKAYNAHDAKAVAALFAIKAEIIDEKGDLTKGREAIEREFARVFKEHPQVSMKVEIDSIRILTPNIAVEEGTVRSKNAPDDKDDVSNYMAAHVKVEGKWQVASVRDFEADSGDYTPHEHLEQLEWLVGEWIEESSEATVHSTVKWHDNGNFLMQEFRVQINGGIAMSGTMRIGWDAVNKQIKSWVFDSQGGYTEGLWLADGDEWIVKTSGATSAGETASAVSVYRYIDKDTVGWRSSQRVIDGERTDDVAEIIVKRRPPSPGQ